MKKNMEATSVITNELRAKLFEVLDEVLEDYEKLHTALEWEVVTSESEEALWDNQLVAYKTRVRERLSRVLNEAL